LSNSSRRRGAVFVCQPMNKRFLRVIALGLGWLAITALVAAILYPLQVAKVWRIDADSRMTTGVILAQDCRNLEQVRYAFDVDGQRYTGAHASESCDSAAKSQQISVYYNAQNPAENTTDDPQGEVNGGFESIVLEGVVLSSFITWRLSKSWRFGSS
jgi:hypothetical protein